VAELIVPRLRARVIGAGLSGLATAWCLIDLGYTVELIDAADRSGGLIETVNTPDGLVERGANAFRWNAVTERWFRTLGIEPAFPQPISRRRYIFRNGRGRQWPLSVRETLALGVQAGTQYLRGTWRARDRETVSAWSDRVLGRAATKWLISPALQGVYGVTSDRLSPRAIRRDGSRRRHGPRFVAPGAGMGEVIASLTRGLRARHATIRLGERLDALDPSIPTVVCTDVSAAASLIGPHAPALGTALRAVESQSMWSATAFFDPAESDIRGFGMLFPRPAGVKALGMLVNTDIFAGRGIRRSETWIYGDDAPCLDTARQWLAADRERVTGRKDNPRRVEISRGSATLPVYGPPVLQVRSMVASAPPWLTVAGNYLGDIGVAGLLAGAEAAATRLAVANASGGARRG